MTHWFRRSFSHTFSWALKLGLTLVAFWLALRGVDFTHIFNLLETQRANILLFTVFFLLAMVLLGALRWLKVLRAIANPNERVFSFMEALKIYYISVFFNCCLPGTVGGDVIRVWIIKFDQLSLHTSINSVIIDRLLALLGLGVLVVITLPALGDAAGFNAEIWLPVLVIVGLISLWIALRMRTLLARFQEWRVARWLLHFINCLHLLLARPKASLIALFYAVMSHVSFCLCIYSLAVGIDAPLTVWQCITLIPLVMLAMTIPVSIGGWGVREASMVGMLGLVGVSKAAALTLSLEYGIINILVSLPAAILWLSYRRSKKT